MLWGSTVYGRNAMRPRRTEQLVRDPKGGWPVLATSDPMRVGGGKGKKERTHTMGVRVESLVAPPSA